MIYQISNTKISNYCKKNLILGFLHSSVFLLFPFSFSLHRLFGLFTQCESHCRLLTYFEVAETIYYLVTERMIHEPHEALLCTWPPADALCRSSLREILAAEIQWRCLSISLVVRSPDKTLRACYISTREEDGSISFWMQVVDLGIPECEYT
jgi:hypothetical protein